MCNTPGLRPRTFWSEPVPRAHRKWRRSLAWRHGASGAAGGWHELGSSYFGLSALARSTRLNSAALKSNSAQNLHHEQRTRWGSSGGKLWHVQARRAELCMWLRARTSKVALRKASPGRARRRRAIELEEHGGQARGATAWAVYAGARVSQQWPAATRGLGKRREQPPGFCFFGSAQPGPGGSGGSDLDILIVTFTIKNGL